MTTALFFCILIFIFSLWYLASPFVSTPDEMVLDDISRGRESLLLQKEEIILGLNELELDYRLNKMSRADYDQLYAEAINEGASVLKKIESVRDDEKKFCHQCGNRLIPESRFCSQCGVMVNG